jgi:hypothetical protein
MHRVVGTTEAAFLLNISASRVRILLQQNRIQGATKQGLVWKIPLFNGMPKISEKKRGRQGTWRRQRSYKPIVIHVNKPQINRNRKHQTFNPVITIRQGRKTTYCHAAEIKGSCRIVYQPEHPLPCGAVVWLEVTPESKLVRL